MNVELATDGLFLTLGKMMPPLRGAGFDVLNGTLFAVATAAEALMTLFAVLVVDGFVGG